MKSSSSLKSVPLGDRLREWSTIFRLLVADRPEGHIRDLSASLAEHNGYALKYLGRPLTECKVLEIGFGARPNRLIWFAGQGVDVTGIDLDRPILTGSPSDFLHVYRTNGAVRALKTLGRWFTNERSLRRALLAELSRRRGARFEMPLDRLVVGSAADPAFWQTHAGADYIFSEDVFEHISAEIVEDVVRLMAASISPTGIAFVKPNIYTGICGGHQLDWYEHTLNQPTDRITEPWEHLRQDRHPADTYVNRFTRAQFRELFQRYFEVLEETVTRPNLGAHFMTPELREELRAYSDEELFSNFVIFILRPKRG